MAKDDKIQDLKKKVEEMKQENKENKQHKEDWQGNETSNAAEKHAYAQKHEKHSGNVSKCTGHKENNFKEDNSQEKIDALTDTLQRLQAEFENYSKRVDREKQEFCRYASSCIIEKILPILDSFEQALKNTSTDEKFRKGIELIYAQLFSLLEKEGLRQINALGAKFDPFKHDVLLTEQSDKEDIVLEELQKGYMLNDKVLRHAKVKIGKN